MAHPQETARLRDMIDDGARISWEIPHARQRAKERGVPLFVAERIIRQGNVTSLSIEADGSERWTVSGRDADGRPVDVVVSPLEGGSLRIIKVITVIRKDG